jgi:hypothetical protein
MAAGGVRFGAWFGKVLAWDGLMPLGVLLVPRGLTLVLPPDSRIIDIIAVILPIVAFSLRIHVGRRHIAANYCGTVARGFQYVVFSFGILVLVPIDCLTVLSPVLPGGLFANPQDAEITVIMFSIYLTSMIIAMYPGCQPGHCPSQQNGFS